MLKRIVFFVFILLSISGILFLYYYIKLQKQPKINPIETIPAETSFYLEAENTYQLIKKIRHENLIYEELEKSTNFSALKEGINIIDSLLQSKNELKELFENQKISCAGIQLQSGAEILFCLRAPDMYFEKKLNEVLQRNFDEVLTTKNDKFKIEQYSVRINNQTKIHIACKKGIILFSTSLEAVNKSISCEIKNSLAENESFKYIYSRIGSGNDLHLIFKNEFFEEKIKKNVNKSTPNTIHFSMETGKGWTALDFQLNTAEISFSGFSKSEGSPFLNSLSQQEPVSMKFIDVLPFTCKNFAFIGISDYQKFIEAANSTNKKKSSPRGKIDSIQIFEKIFGGEIVIARTKSSEKENIIGLISIKEKESAKEFLLSKSITTNDTLFYLKDKWLFETISGNFINAKFNFAQIVDEYILFTNDKDDIAKFFTDLQREGVYSRSKYFERIKKCNLSEETNFYIHTEFSESYRFLKGFFNDNLSREFETLESSFKEFSASGIQLTNDNSGTFVQGYFLHSPSTRQNNFSIWECQLDTLCTRLPQQVINHTSGAKEIFIQDENDNIYLISNLGKIIWKKKLAEKLIGRVYQIDFYKNEKLQLLCSSENFIYLIDRNGNYVNGFPLRLKEKASNAMSVFDYEKNKDYRVLLCGQSGKVYNYKLQDSSLVEGFNFPLLETGAKIPIQYLKLTDKEYLLAIDGNGKIHLTNRKGEVKSNILHRMKNATIQPEIYLGNKMENTFLVNYDNQNKTIQKINLTGQEEIISIETENNSSFHKMEFITEDAMPDIVLGDQTGHEIVNELGKIIFKFESKEELKPVVNIHQKNDIVYLLQRDVNGNLYVSTISSDGTHSFNLKKNGIICYSEPLLTNLFDGTELYLLTAVNNKLLCYLFEKN